MQKVVGNLKWELYGTPAKNDTREKGDEQFIVRCMGAVVFLKVVGYILTDTAEHQCLQLIIDQAHFSGLSKPAQKTAYKLGNSGKKINWYLNTMEGRSFPLNTNSKVKHKKLAKDITLENFMVNLHALTLCYHKNQKFKALTLLNEYNIFDVKYQVTAEPITTKNDFK